MCHVIKSCQDVQGLINLFILLPCPVDSVRLSFSRLYAIIYQQTALSSKNLPSEALANYKKNKFEHVTKNLFSKINVLFPCQIFPRLYMDIEIITGNECNRTNSPLQMSEKFRYLSHPKRTTANRSHRIHISVRLFATKRKYKCNK